MPTLTPMRGECFICGNWGTALQRIGKGLGRHEDCSPGSPLWLEWYAKQPKAKRTTAGNELYKGKTGHYPA
jgi:hypothetical protein